MYRFVAVLVLASGLAGCSHDPRPEAPEESAGEPSGPSSQECALARWQAQTAPVIGKREGQEALDTGEAESLDGAKPCR
jgi:hypothetical protein